MRYLCFVVVLCAVQSIPDAAYPQGAGVAAKIENEQEPQKAKVFSKEVEEACLNQRVGRGGGFGGPDDRTVREWLKLVKDARSERNRIDAVA